MFDLVNPNIEHVNYSDFPTKHKLLSKSYNTYIKLNKTAKLLTFQLVINQV